MHEETANDQYYEEIADWFSLWEGSIWDVDWTQQWNAFIALYGAPFTRYIISFVYYIYVRATLLNVVIFIIKYVPTVIYIYKLIKNVYIASREKIKEKQMELEDIKLQMKIVNNKLRVRDAEMSDRAEELRRATARLRLVRARVRDAIAADPSLRAAAELASRAPPYDMHDSNTTNSEDDYIGELLTELKFNYSMPDKASDPDCTENQSSAETGPDESVYSSLTDDSKNCRVKIVKVTNVYKVAYLRNYIKQKRLRRANRHAVIKKKMESIKRLLESWQDRLNTVINSKLSVLDLSARGYELAAAHCTQEAMGDFSKPNMGSDDESVELSNEYDECGVNWPRNNRNFDCNQFGGFDEYQEPSHSGDYSEPAEFGPLDVKYGGSMHIQCECSKLASNVLFILPEETSSQVAIEDVADTSDTDPMECQSEIRCEV